MHLSPCFYEEAILMHEKMPSRSHALRHALGRRNFQLFCYGESKGVEEEGSSLSVLGVDANQKLQGVISDLKSGNIGKNVKSSGMLTARLDN